ncbi:MAG TPA: RNA 2',3'-cyclic phosphodiesterase [Vicinamibacterales bacterium]|nr:RNA 2',3'-cyclic phosphodiesterase [Vicinamibacterales bacterium]
MAGVTARVFVAVDVGDAVRREAARVITALAAKLDAAPAPPKITWVKPASLHVTIKFLGDVAVSDLDQLRSRLAPPIAIAPFDVHWRGIGTFPNSKHPRALWVGVIDGAARLAQIEAEVSRRLAGDAAFELDDRALLPHLTLGRVKMAGRGIDWPKLLQACEVRQAVSHIDRVSLYQSRLSQQGPHYTELVAAPLVGR